MVTTTVAPIKRAVVQTLRASAPLQAAIVGGIHESIAPRKVRYPFIVYQVVSAPRAYQYDGMQIHALIDVTTYAVNPVDANNIDALVCGALDEAELDVEGQSQMACRRTADLPTGPDTDASGKRIYQVGGSYSVWTDQPL